MFDEGKWLCDECGEKLPLRKVIVLNSKGIFEAKELCEKCMLEYLPIVEGSDE